MGEERTVVPVSPEDQQRLRQLAEEAQDRLTEMEEIIRRTLSADETGKEVATSRSDRMSRLTPESRTLQ